MSCGQPISLDVDSTQNYEVVRRKVFFDDIPS